MSQCTNCGTNFVGTPEQPIAPGLLCKWCYIDELTIRVQALTTALRDAISTYGPKDEVLVTEERQEAWQATLDKHGWKDPVQ